MQIRTYFFYLLFSCLACHNNHDEKSESEVPTENIDSIIPNETVFDKIKWQSKEGKDYPYREKMLKDVMTNQDLKRLKEDEILDLLGKPDRIDSNYIFYVIDQKRLGSWPLHTKTMIIKFSDDSIEWVKIHE
ncbi:MAG TPA: hypothetical protein VFG10_03410 [Saprospiraceae bacterium]|nr:hypothetical protein [Saprospiraceae bacterium]